LLPILGVCCLVYFYIDFTGQNFITFEPRTFYPEPITLKNKGG
jgi:hypothetical protein